MTLFFSILLLTLLSVAYAAGHVRARVLSQRGSTRLRSLPRYYGSYTFLWALIPVIVVSATWIIAEPFVLKRLVVDSISQEYLVEKDLGIVLTEVRNIARGALNPAFADEELAQAAREYKALERFAVWLYWLALLAAAAIGFTLTIRRVRAEFSARAGVERVFRSVLLLCSCIAVLTTAGIIGSLIFESLRFFQKVPITQFLFGLHWSPQMAIRADQVASEGAFGALPLLAGTCLIAFIAMCVATPVGLFSAIYLSEYAGGRLRKIAKPLLEILAGIPTVVYGFFAVITVAPVLRTLGVELGWEVSSESALAAGLVMGVMIIPFISSLSDDVINAVPQALRDASYALGATKSETIKQVVLPAALPGVMGAVLLGVSRAIGETMIVVMAAGLAANLTINPLENVTTVTVQIVTILVGDQEFESAKTLAAFALGLLLFCVTFVLNVIALRIVNRYREKYE